MCPRERPDKPTGEGGQDERSAPASRPPVRIGIDATLVRPDRLTGLERHARGLLAALARRAPGELVVFVRPDAPPEVTALPVEVIRAPLTARVPVDQVWLPWAARRARVDLLHGLAFPTPLLWTGRSVVTLHDAGPWLYPETRSRGMRLYYGPLYRPALARAAAVLTVSEASRRDLTAALGLEPGRVNVTPNGVEPGFFEAARPPRPVRPYLLAVGTLEPRKNLPVLLGAVTRLLAAGHDLRLVVAGRRGWGPPLELGALASHVTLAGAVADAELPPLYAGAACLVQASRHEGFGLAVAEAMAAGTPVVASDIAAHREIGGDTIRYADPRSPDAFAAAVEAVLDEPPAAAAARRARARARARGFTWDACAEATLAVYRRVLAVPAPTPRPVAGARPATASAGSPTPRR
jgi:glycosyltransferase involved in cell wall biosynthesis